MTQHLLDIAEVDDALLDLVLSGEVVAGQPFALSKVVALMFLSPSMRTRVGFAVAAIRLGATAVDVHDLRFTPDMSDAESLDDTLRVVSGMADVVVLRSDAPLDRTMVRDRAACPVVNGGDPGGEHPTQALIDAFAMVRMKGELSSLRVAICGDLTMRAVRSMLALFSRRPPRALVLIAPPQRRAHGVSLSPALAPVVEVRGGASFEDVDVVLMAGLPPGPADFFVDPPTRAAYALSERNVGTLAGDAVVLSPMPVIDEISTAVRHDPRVRMYEQSDLGVSVRCAVLRALSP
jgi:aspartate carbamoyltransferase catalytic subunit